MKSKPTNREHPEGGAPAAQASPDGGEAPPQTRFAIRYSAPLPLPSAFEAYERTLPGSANRILRIAEEEQHHRVVWENKALDARVNSDRRAQLVGATLALVCVGGAIYLAANGERIVASVMAGVTALGLVGGFWIRRPLLGGFRLLSTRRIAEEPNRSESL